MNIWLVGGTTVIPTSVETAIKGDGYNVTRVAGADRYETAAAIAEAGIKLNGGKKPSKVFIASGDSFADALAVSPVAFVKGYPIILTGKDKTSDASKKELGIIGTDTKILVGGTAVVSDSVAKDLTVSTRVAGDDRAVTANLVSDWAKKSEGFNPANAALVGGTNGNGADSLVASALGGKSFTTLHFAGWPATNVYLKDHSAELTGKGFVFGGPAAVSGDQVGAAQSAAQSAGAPLSVMTADSAIKKVSSGSTTKANQGAVTYTIKVADSNATVNIALVDSANVVSTDAGPKFKDSSLLGTTAGASIESVNGAVIKAADTTGNVVKTTAKGGTITLVVDSVSAATVTPVVWLDKTGGTTAQLDFATNPTAAAPQMPSETFAVGTSTRWIPEDFAGGAVGTDQLVTFVNKAEKYFTTASATYRYDDNDTYYIGTDGIPRSMDYFVARLTVGDELEGSTAGATLYAPTSAQSSKFTLNNLNPSQLSAPTLVTATNSSMVLTVAASVPTVDTTFKVYGKEGSGSTITTDDSVLVSSSTDADATTAGFQVKVSGLKAGTTYSVASTQTIDSEESVISPSANRATIANSVPVSSNIAISDAQGTGVTGNGALSAGDTVEFTFDQAVTLGSGWSFTLRSGTTNVTLDSSNSTTKQLSSGKILQVKLGDDYPIGGNFATSGIIQVVAAAGVTNATGTYAPLVSGDREVGAALGVNQAGGTAAVASNSGTPQVTITTAGSDFYSATNTAYVFNAATGELVGKANVALNGSGTSIATNLTLESGKTVAASTDYKVVLVKGTTTPGVAAAASTVTAS